MLRQLLSSANGTASSNYDHCSTLPLTSRYSENSTMLLPTSPVMQSSLIQQQQPLPVHQQQQQPPTVLQQQPHTANLPTQNHQFREWIGNDKNLATLENMSLAGYSMQSSAPTNNLGIADANNDLNGTTELFSSTYAMLSADNVFSWNFWDEQSRFSQNANEMQLSMNRQDFGYPVHTTAPGCSSNTRFQSRSADPIDNNPITDGEGMISNNRLELHQPVILSNCDSVGNRNYIPQENCSENLNQMAQFRFADSYRRTPQISVTGRSELNPMGSNSAVGNVQVSTHKNASSNGVDPICPYCDRFISHYKGNIRRHMNQCVKSARNGGKLRKKDAALKQFTSGISQFGEGCSEAAYSDSYQPHALETSLAEKNAWMDRSVTITEQSQTTKSKSYSIKKDRNTDDSFRCPLCDFSTIYKGNMKRHLSTCHGLQDDDLKDGCIDKLKCKEAMNLRAENATRSRRSKNYLKSTPKSVDINPKNGSTPATSRMPEMITNASSSSAQLIPPTNICKEPSLSTDCSFNGSLTLEVGSLDSSSKTIEVPVDGSIQLVKSNTIDETIEAVIANGNENLLDHITSNGYLMSEPKYSV